MSDLTGCYDRIIHNAAALVLLRSGIISNAKIHSMFQTIQRMIHRVCTAFRDCSELSYGRYDFEDWQFVPHGILQGNTSGPAIRTIISSFILFNGAGNERSWVIRNFSMNSPVSLTPSCSATPIGAISRSGICSACSSTSNKRLHPFLISLESRALFLRCAACFSADLWLPHFKAASTSFRRTSSSSIYFLYWE